MDDIFDRLRKRVRGNRIARSVTILSCKRLRSVSAVRVGSCAVAFLARRSATRHLRTSRPGRRDWSFPLSPGGAHGVQPFAGSFPPTAGRIISDRPDPHAFSPRRPTRLIFVGLARFAVSVRVRETGERAWDESMLASGFAPVCDPFRDLRGARAPDGIGRDRSCLGLCLLQGCGHAFVQSTRARTRVSHRPPERPLSLSHPLMGLNADPLICAFALQRFRGADALPIPRRFESPRSELPV